MFPCIQWSPECVWCCRWQNLQLSHVWHTLLEPLLCCSRLAAIRSKGFGSNPSEDSSLAFRVMVAKQRPTTIAGVKLPKEESKRCSHCIRSVEKSEWCTIRMYFLTFSTTKCCAGSFDCCTICVRVSLKSKSRRLSEVVDERVTCRTTLKNSSSSSRY